MPVINFNQVADAEDFSPLPEGQYLCSVNNIEETHTQHGDDLWKMKFTVLSGKYQGRFIFDNLVFSQAALKRVKLVCSRLGIDVSGEVNLTPDLFLNKNCRLTVEIDEYTDKEGKVRQKNVVPFAGYEAVDPDEAALAEVSGEDLSEGDLAF